MSMAFRFIVVTVLTDLQQNLLQAAIGLSLKFPDALLGKFRGFFTRY